MWFAIMAVSFVAGSSLGIIGLVLSMLTACSVLENTHSVSIMVTSMIVASLGLLLFGAHSMDRVDEEARISRSNESDEIFNSDRR
jgi:cytochrome c biogenesis protein CcdA